MDIPKHFSILTWNANSLRKRKDELVQFLHDNNVGVVLVQETLLKPGMSFQIPNYSLYRNDRERRRGGGTAILVKKDIPHLQIPTPTLSALEATMIQIKTPEFNFSIISLYIPARAENLTEDLQKLASISGPIFIAGDFNAQHRAWGSRSTNHQGGKINEVIIEQQMNLLVPEEPTHYSHGRATIIDYGLTKDFHHSVRLKVLNELSSDHNPILFLVEDVFIDEPLPTRKITNWCAFRQSLANDVIDTSSLMAEDINTTIKSLSDKISDTITRYTKISLVKKHNPYDLPDEIKKLIRHKNRIRRRAGHTGDPSLRREANRLTQIVRDRIYEFKNERWGEFLSNIDPGGSKLWQTAKYFRSQNVHVMPPIDGTNGTQFSQEGKAEAFAEAFEQQFTENPAENNYKEHENSVNDSAQNILLAPTLTLNQTSREIRQTNVEEVQTIVRKLVNRKSPGHDGITNYSLKHLPENILKIISAIINNILQSRIYPEFWKMAIVSVVPKPNKNLSRPENWRPISLLPSIAKIAEQIILNRLNEEVDVKSIIPDEQFGFRANHSTELQLARVVQHIKTGFNHKRSTGMVLFDVAKAFDKVWHAGLIFKMQQFQIPLPIIQLIGSFLSNRCFRVRVGKHLSANRPIKAGVPQGSPLSPLLYSLYTADIPKNAFTKMALYADDTCVFNTSKLARSTTSALQSHIEQIIEYFHKWKIKINAKKTQAIYFTHRPNFNPTEVMVEGIPIPWAPTAKYLGLKFDKRLTWRPHIDEKRLVCGRTIDKIQPLLKSGRLNNANKRLLYIQIVRPCLLYGCVALGKLLKQVHKRLEAGQNIALRKIFKIPWFIRNNDIHRDLKIDKIDKYIRDRAVKLFDITDNHTNEAMEILKIPSHPRHHHSDLRLLANNT